MCESLETTGKVADGQEKMNNSFNKMNLWNHIVSLCTDDALFCAQ